MFMNWVKEIKTDVCNGFRGEGMNFWSYVALFTSASAILYSIFVLGNLCELVFNKFGSVAYIASLTGVVSALGFASFKLLGIFNRNHDNEHER